MLDEVSAAEIFSKCERHAGYHQDSIKDLKGFGLIAVTKKKTLSSYTIVWIRVSLVCK